MQCGSVARALREQKEMTTAQKADRHSRARRLRDQGLTLGVIGKRFGVSAQAIAGWLKEAK